SIPPHLLERLPEVFHAAEVVNQRPTAAGLVGMAQAAVVDVAEGLATTPQPLVPLYLRRPDAKEPAAKPRSAAIPEVELYMKLRELVRDDAARCAELEMQLFAGETPWSKENFELEFQQPYNFYLGVEDENQLIGY